MKHIILILFAVLFALSCSKDIDTNTQIDTSILNFKKYEELLSTVDLDLFKNNSKVIFKNGLGAEKIMSISLTESSQKQSVNGQDIVLPKMAVNYYDASDTKYVLYFYLTTNVLDNNLDQNASLTASVFTNLVEFTPSISFNHLGNPFACTYNNNNIILGKTFDFVYSSIPSKEFEIFSELHFTKTLGIVGFRDTNNELWVFERFAE